METPRQLKLRQRDTGRARAGALGDALAFTRIEAAQTRWRAVTAPHRVALVRASAVLNNDKLIE